MNWTIIAFWGGLIIGLLTGIGMALCWAGEKYKVLLDEYTDLRVALEKTRRGR